MKSLLSRGVALLTVFLMVSAVPSPAYSVLTHEAVIDVVFEKLFEDSFNATVIHYQGLIAAEAQGHLELPNQNFDVGKVTVRGQYNLADKTCAKLLARLTKQDILGIDPDLKTQLLTFYAEPAPGNKIPDRQER